MVTVTVNWREYRYRIEPGWRRATSRILGVTHIEAYCIPVDAMGIAVETKAIGFRADWGGERPGSAWLPRSERSWWGPVAESALFVDGPRGPEPAPSPRVALIEVGQHGDDWNVPRALYEGSGAVSLTAIHADGARESLGRIDLASDVAVTLEGTITDITPPGGVRESTPTVEEHDHDHRGILFGLAIASGLAALFAVLTGRRRRRPTWTG
jgi:hypothetical protein